MRHSIFPSHIICLVLVGWSYAFALAEDAVGVSSSLVRPIAGAQAGGWHQTLEEGLRVATEQTKPVLLKFTQHGACVACQEMETDVFTQPDFIKLANDYVLVELDYVQSLPIKPSLRKGKLVNKQTDTRAQARAFYGVESFPTVLVLLPNGVPYGGVIGAVSMRDFTAELKRAEYTRAKLQEPLVRATTLQGADKVAALLQAWVLVQDNTALRACWQQIVMQADPEDFSGFGREKTIQKSIDKQLADFYQVMSQKAKSLTAPAQISEAILGYLSKDDLLPDTKQIIVADVFMPSDRRTGGLRSCPRDCAQVCCPSVSHSTGSHCHQAGGKDTYQ